jgi:hypothetical protein
LKFNTPSIQVHLTEYILGEKALAKILVPHLLEQVAADWINKSVISPFFLDSDCYMRFDMLNLVIQKQICIAI